MSQISIRAALGALLLAAITGTAHAAVEQARGADDFIDSIGMNIHLPYTNTAYGDYKGLVKPRLLELGVRHVRGIANIPHVIEKTNELAALGIKSTFGATPRDKISADNIVGILKQFSPGAISLVEGPNEPDIWPINYNGKTWQTGALTDYQNDIYAALKADAATRDITVLTFTLANPTGYAKVGRVPADMGNMHTYPNDFAAWLPGAKLDSIHIPAMRGVVGSDKPIMVTEFGWRDVEARYHISVPFHIKAKYVTRSFFEFFNRGVVRAYYYQLIDDKPNNHHDAGWGLIKHDGNNADGTPKATPTPAFFALKNLISVLTEPTTGFAPGQLDYALNGDTSGISRTLLQKADGRFYLVLYQNAANWDTGAGRTTRTGKELTVAPKAVTLTLASPAAAIKTYLPVNGTSATSSTAKTTSVTLSVPDHPLIVEITP